MLVPSPSSVYVFVIFLVIVPKLLSVIPDFQAESVAREQPESKTMDRDLVSQILNDGATNGAGAIPVWLDGHESLMLVG